MVDPFGQMMSCSDLCVQVAKLIAETRKARTGSEWASTISQLSRSSSHICLVIESVHSECAQRCQMPVPLEVWIISCDPSKEEYSSGVDPIFVQSAVRSHLHFSPLTSWISSHGMHPGTLLNMRLILPENVIDLSYNFVEHIFPPSKLMGGRRCVISVKFIRSSHMPRPLHSCTENLSHTYGGSTANSVGSRLDDIILPPPDQSLLVTPIKPPNLSELAFPPSDLFSSSEWMPYLKLGSLALTPVSPDSACSHTGANLSSFDDPAPKLRAIEQESNEKAFSSARRIILCDARDGRMVNEETNISLGNPTLEALLLCDRRKPRSPRKLAHPHFNKIGLPLHSSPARLKRDRRSSCVAGLPIPSPNKNGHAERLVKSAPNKSLLGNFEESALNGRLEPLAEVEGFSLQLAASSQTFSTQHFSLPVQTFFFDSSPDSIPSPYLGLCSLESLGRKGIRIPSAGTLQATLFNTVGTVVHMFVVKYDLSDMPPRTRTFIRQRSFLVERKEGGGKWLRHLIHFRFLTGRRGFVRLHSDVRMLFSQNNTLDAVNLKSKGDENRVGDQCDLYSFTEMPRSPVYSPVK